MSYRDFDTDPYKIKNRKFNAVLQGIAESFSPDT